MMMPPHLTEYTTTRNVCPSFTSDITPIQGPQRFLDLNIETVSCLQSVMVQYANHAEHHYIVAIVTGASTFVRSSNNFIHLQTQVSTKF